GPGDIPEGTDVHSTPMDERVTTCTLLVVPLQIRDALVTLRAADVAALPPIVQVYAFQVPAGVDKIPQPVAVPALFQRHEDGPFLYGAACDTLTGEPFATI